MDRRFTPPKAKRVTSPTWGPPPPCKQGLRCIGFSQLHMMIHRNESDCCPAILMSAKGSLVSRRSRPGQSWTLPWAVMSPRDTREQRGKRDPKGLGWAKGSLGFLNLNSINKIIQSSSTLRTPRYFGQFSLSLGKESPYILSNSTCLIYGHPVTKDTFYGPLSVRINGVWLYYITNCRLRIGINVMLWTKLGKLPFNWENRKSRMENQTVRAIPLGSFRKYGRCSIRRCNFSTRFSLFRILGYTL